MSEAIARPDRERSGQVRSNSGLELIRDVSKQSGQLYSKPTRASQKQAESNSCVPMRVDRQVG